MKQYIIIIVCVIYDTNKSKIIISLIIYLATLRFDGSLHCSLSVFRIAESDCASVSLSRRECVVVCVAACCSL